MLRSSADPEVRVLVVAGDAELGEAVRGELIAAGLRTDLARDLEEARRLAARDCHDAFAIDVCMPAGAGYRFVSELREAGREEPVLLLSASHAREDFLPVQRGWRETRPVVRQGLADAPQILRALLRHERPGIARWLHYGGIALDRVERRACIDDDEVRLTPAEWGILEQLLARAEHVVDRSLLQRAVWGPDPDLSSNALDVHIGHLRSKLRSASCRARIETVRGQGYLLRLDYADENAR